MIILVVHAPNSLVFRQPHVGKNLPHLRKVTILANHWVGPDGGEDNLSSQLIDITASLKKLYRLGR